MAAYVKFWGVRGSIPTPASWTRVYGGNTSCVEIRFGETIFVFDAGSGIRELGRDLMERTPRPTELHLLISHTHWDHIQGFPFFTPAYLPGMQIRIYGRDAGDNDRYRLLTGQMSSQYFPVSFHDLGAKINFDHLQGGQRVINGVKVTSFPLNHPGGCHGYSIEKDGLKIVYAPDNELEIQTGDVFPDPTHSGALRSVPQGLVESIRQADLAIIDAQYDDVQYSFKKGWGHSSCLSTTDLGIRSEVKNLALFHHDPESTDREIDAKIKSCRERTAAKASGMVVFAAREGVELKLYSEGKKSPHRARTQNGK